MIVFITFQCTKKLIAEMKVTVSDKERIVAEPLYRWHAHLFFYQRRKCVLVMNNVTRYNFVMYGLKKGDFNRFDQLVKEKIAENLLADGIAQTRIEKYLQNIGEATYTETSDRSILSLLNDMIWIAQDDMDRNMRESNELGIDQVNRFLNDYIMTKLPQLFPRQAMLEALEEL
ncbi:hypothetical protein B5G50_22305 [Brevibacillus brevis]|uniref:DUF6933 domain-containing protein n=1 Tax=Brevibacillus brevis TaxID=1393 RepID=UPI000B394306|nr:hypothetical protein B5G50_22305 [Brevibacillus brevis]